MSTSQRTKSKSDVDGLDLPAKVESLYGETVDLRDKDQWRLYANPEKRGVVMLPVGMITRPPALTVEPGNNWLYGARRRSVFSPASVRYMQLFVVHYIKRKKPSSVRVLITALASFERYLAGVHRFGDKRRRYQISDILYDELESYARWLTKKGVTQGVYPALFRSFYAWGIRNHYSGFSKSVFGALKTIKVKGTLRGHIARFRDPIKGAYSWEEQKQMTRAIDADEGSPRDRAVVMLFRETGMRAEAAIRLLRCHLEPSPSGFDYILRIPRVKQRAATNETYERVISRELGELLLQLQAGNDCDFMLHWLQTQKPWTELDDAVKRWGRDVGLVTTRLADGDPRPLPMTTYRFRRTVATNLAEEGASPEVIAEWLDDKTIGMAAVYAANSSSIVEILAETLDRHPAWSSIIRIFLGDVEDEDSAELPSILGGAPHFAKYHLYVKRIGLIGKCASPVPCAEQQPALYPPLSCYLCQHFRAAKDERVHRAQLEQLKDEVNASVGAESDRVAGILREHMLAVLQVIATVRTKAGKATTSNDARKAVRRFISTTKTSIG